MEQACLGSRSLHPHRQLLAGDEYVPLGKRALQLLSTLAEARGEVVTKDELFQAVWPGTIVEENALQAQIVALRKALGPDASRLKTIRGIGYKLEVDPEIGATATPPSTRPVPWPRSSVQALAAIALAAAAVAGFGWRTPPAGEAVEVAAIDASGGAQAALLAGNLNGEVINVLSRAGIATRESGTVSPWYHRPPRTEVRLGGTVLQDGGQLLADMRMEDIPSGTVLWSERFTGPVSRSDALAVAASAAAARTLYTVRELMLQKDVPVDPATIALLLRAADLVRSYQPGDEATPREIYTRVVERMPRLAHGHAMLALVMVGEGLQALENGRADPFAETRAQAARAIAIDPAGAGAAYDALYGAARLEHPSNPAAAERWLREGLDKAPGFAFLWMRQCRFLGAIGRINEALEHCRRGLALHPYAEPIIHGYARILWAAGRPQMARETMDRAALLAPAHGRTTFGQFQFAALSGDGPRALELLDGEMMRFPDFTPAGAALMRRYLDRIGRWRPAERETLARDFERAGRTEDITFDFAVMALATLGADDAAFRLLESAEPRKLIEFDYSAYLFQPHTRRLRADPRFWRLAARIGLAGYWRSSGRWPDFCGKEMPLDRCRSEAARVLPAA